MKKIISWIIVTAFCLSSFGWLGWILVIKPCQEFYKTHGIIGVGFYLAVLLVMAIFMIGLFKALDWAWDQLMND